MGHVSQRYARGPLGSQVREKGARDRLESSTAAKRVYLAGILKVV